MIAVVSQVTYEKKSNGEGDSLAFLQKIAIPSAMQSAARCTKAKQKKNGVRK